MLEFKQIGYENIGAIRPYFAKYPKRLCEYTALVKAMWAGYYKSAYAIADDTLYLTESYGDGRRCFPLPLGPDIPKALGTIEDYVMAKGIKLELTTVPDEENDFLRQRYKHAKIMKDRTWSDYLYRSGELKDFPGKPFSTQRNHVSRFMRSYPDWAFRIAGPADEKALEAFYRDFARQAGADDDPERNYELGAAYGMLSHLDAPGLLAGYLTAEGRIAAFAVGEIVGDTLFEHIEKADRRFEGSYAMIVREFARAFGGDAAYINREDDAGDLGLRTSKLRYHPCALLGKSFYAENSYADFWPALPRLQTERLVLRPILEKDKKDYLRLSIDDSLNRYWGYDYRQDLNGRQPDADYFFGMVGADFSKRDCFVFVIADSRTDCLCGECVLYNFDDDGRAELGVRLLPEYQHHGLAGEAGKAVACFGYDKLRLTAVNICAYEENSASLKMIHSLNGIFKETKNGRMYFVLPSKKIRSQP